MTADNNMPTKIICGYKSDISTAGERLTDRIEPITRIVTVKVRSLGTGSYIAIGDEDEQPYRLTGVGESQDIYIDDVSKIVVITDVGETGCLEWFGS